MDWQPIDTAPENVPILVRGPAGVSLVERCRGAWFVISEGEWVWEAGYDNSFARATNPTEWHPVPA